VIAPRVAQTVSKFEYTSPGIMMNTEWMLHQDNRFFFWRKFITARGCSSSDNVGPVLLNVRDARSHLFSAESAACLTRSRLPHHAFNAHGVHYMCSSELEIARRHRVFLQMLGSQSLSQGHGGIVGHGNAFSTSGFCMTCLV